MGDPAAFPDIRMVGVDEKRTVQSHPGTAMYFVHIKLSARPPQRWAELFAEQRRFPRHSMWRTAEVEDDCIVINCPVAEIAQHHQKDLEEDVSVTNQKYRAYVAAEQQRREAERLRDEAERQRVGDEIKKLKF